MSNGRFNSKAPEPGSNLDLFHTIMPCVMPADSDPPEDFNLRIQAQEAALVLFKRAERWEQLGDVLAKMGTNAVKRFKDHEDDDMPWESQDPLIRAQSHCYDKEDDAAGAAVEEIEALTIASVLAAMFKIEKEAEG